MILIDTSVWVSHLRSGDTTLERLLLDAEVLCHPFVLGELACGNLKNRREMFSLLRALPEVPVVAQEEFLRFVEAHQLAGTGIGLVDVHLLASARLAQVLLWTKDRTLADAARRLNLLLA